MAGNTWLGVIQHLTFTGYFGGVNGLGTWGIGDSGAWKVDLPFLNRRDVPFKYQTAAEVRKERETKKETGTTVGGTAWEGTIPGKLLGLPDNVEGKVIIQESHPDVTYLANISGEFGGMLFKRFIEKLGAGLFMNDRIWKRLGPFKGHLLPFFQQLAANAPNFKVSGALGFGLGITRESFESGQWKPYLRLLTLAELKLQTNLAGAAGGLGSAAARYVDAHEIDLLCGRGGGRSWQISRFENIPRQ